MLCVFVCVQSRFHGHVFRRQYKIFASNTSCCQLQYHSVNGLFTNMVPNFPPINTNLLQIGRSNLRKKNQFLVEEGH
jgi:hypothetical protein